MGYGQLRLPDLARIVLHPAGMGKMLGVLMLRHRHRRALAVEQDRAGTGGPLVQGENVALGLHVRWILMVGSSFRQGE